MADALHGADDLIGGPSRAPTGVRLREVRVRIDRAVAASLPDAELRRRIAANLPPELERSVAEATATELLRAVRRAARGSR